MDDKIIIISTIFFTLMSEEGTLNKIISLKYIT